MVGRWKDAVDEVFIIQLLFPELLPPFRYWVLTVENEAEESVSKELAVH